MSIVKRGNSKHWYMQFQLNGKTYIRSSKTTNKKAAVQMEAEWRTQLHANPVSYTHLTLPTTPYV